MTSRCNLPSSTLPLSHLRLYDIFLYYNTYNTGDQWKDDVERESRSQSSRSHSSLASYLLDHLRDNYPGVYWAVIVYDDVTGYPKHTVRGSYYHLFRHHGHNIVVGRIIPGPSIHAPNNLGRVLTQSYRKRQDCTFRTRCRYILWICTPEVYEDCTVNAQRTNRDTWDALQRQVSPVMLHVVRAGISAASSTWGVTSYVESRNMDGAFVTLLARRQ